MANGLRVETVSCHQYVLALILIGEVDRADIRTHRGFYPPYDDLQSSLQIRCGVYLLHDAAKYIQHGS